MNTDCQNKKYGIRDTRYEQGFSLTEVLLAVGTLAVGMLFIAGVFPVSIHFTTVAAERTIAATVTDEAFAKIKLYGIYDPNLSYVSHNLYENISAPPVPSYEFGYPSTTDDLSQRYWWSAICRRVGPADVQVTVFISRKAGVGTTYLSTLNPVTYPPIRPVAYRVQVTLTGNDLQISNPAQKTLINDGYTIVDDASGRIYRVLERYGANLDLLRLNEIWRGGANAVWVIPPPVNGGRYPCIAVYQKIMRF